MKDDTIKLVKNGIIASAGANIASSIGGTAGANAAQGISNLTNTMPMSGSIIGMKNLLKGLKDLKQ